jgi:hypothetical protein
MCLSNVCLHFYSNNLVPNIVLCENNTQAYRRFPRDENQSNTFELYLISYYWILMPLKRLVSFLRVFGKCPVSIPSLLKSIHSHEQRSSMLSLAGTTDSPTAKPERSVRPNISPSTVMQIKSTIPINISSVLPLIDPSEESVKVRAAPKRARKTNLGDTIKF